MDTLLQHIFNVMDVRPDGTLTWSDRCPRRKNLWGAPVSIRTGRDGYQFVRVKFDGKKRDIKVHRIVLASKLKRWPTITDHINRKRDDNRLVNLREVTPQENNLNRGPYTINKHRLGVYWDKSRNSWKARCGKRGVNRKHVGRFPLFCKAWKAAKIAEEKLQGGG